MGDYCEGKTSKFTFMITRKIAALRPAFPSSCKGALQAQQWGPLKIHFENFAEFRLDNFAKNPFAKFCGNLFEIFCGNPVGKF